MSTEQKYQVGQRWQFATDVAEFEDTLVIAEFEERHPEWGNHDDRYKVYVRYSSTAAPQIPPNYDGAVMSLTIEGLDQNCTKLLESDVKLPWWWKYGIRVADGEKAPTGMSHNRISLISAELPWRFRSAKQLQEATIRRAKAIEDHRAKYRGRPEPVRPTSVAESWERLIAWLKEAEYPDLKLNRGATDKAIASFEEAIDAKLPPDFVESVRIHDGGLPFYLPPFYGDLLSLKDILKQWKKYRGWRKKGDYAQQDWVPTDFRGPIKPIFWNLKRIYVTDNSGDHLTLDLDPPDDGTYGQVLDHSHEVGPRRVLASNWSEFMADLVVDFESGKYVYLKGDYELTFIAVPKE